MEGGRAHEEEPGLNLVKSGGDNLLFMKKMLLSQSEALLDEGFYERLVLIGSLGSFHFSAEQSRC